MLENKTVVELRDLAKKKGIKYSGLNKADLLKALGAKISKKSKASPAKSKKASPKKATKKASPKKATKKASPKKATKKASPKKATKKASPKKATKKFRKSPPKLSKKKLYMLHDQYLARLLKTKLNIQNEIDKVVKQYNLSEYDVYFGKSKTILIVKKKQNDKDKVSFIRLLGKHYFNESNTAKQFEAKIKRYSKNKIIE
jgi:hypothetical protein